MSAVSKAIGANEPSYRVRNDAPSLFGGNKGKAPMVIDDDDEEEWEEDNGEDTLMLI